jgi:hypothetical protein
MFLIAPPLLLPTGAALLGSRLLPRPFAWAAVAFGAISVVLGLAALFSAAAFSAAIVLIVAQNLWVLAALFLLARGASASEAPAPALQGPRTSGSTAARADHGAGHAQKPSGGNPGRIKVVVGVCLPVGGGVPAEGAFEQAQVRSRARSAYPATPPPATCCLATNHACQACGLGHSL